MSQQGIPGKQGAEPAARTYEVHGIRVSIASDGPAFLTLADLMLGAFRSHSDSAESLSVRLETRVRGWMESPRSLAVRQGPEERLGTAEFQEGESVHLKADLYSVSYADGSDAAVRASFVLDRRSRLRRLVAKEQPWQILFSLFRFGVQEPILLKLERRGMVLLHASVAAQDSRAIVLLGLNGSGKSSLCASLLDRLDYVSDNFAAWDGDHVLGFPSALRVAGAAPGQRIDLPSLHGKSFMQPDPARVRTTARPAALVLMSLGASTSLTPLEPSEAYRRILEIGDMTHEFPRHSYLGPLAPLPDLARVEELARRVPAYRLVMSRTADARQAVLGLL